MINYEVIASKIQHQQPTSDSVIIGDDVTVQNIMDALGPSYQMKTIIYTGEPFHHRNVDDPAGKLDKLTEWNPDQAFICFQKTLDGLKVEQLVNKCMPRLPVCNFNGPPYIFLYQMGKVGSRTISRSLANTFLPYNLQYDVHWLDWKRVVGRVRKLLEHQYYQASINLIERTAFFRKMIENGEHAKWKFITMVREPVARSISVFFQEKESLDPEFNKNCKQGNVDIDELIQEYMNVTYELDNYVSRDVPDRWFDEEIKAVLGIDVYNSEFNCQAGFKIYDENETSLLLIRMENINDVAQLAVKQFLNLEQFELLPENISRDKGYFTVYSEFKKKIRFSDEMLDMMYNTRYARHFYTESERRALKKQWKNSDGGLK